MADTIATLVARLEGDGTGFYTMLGAADRRITSFEARVRTASRNASAAFSGIAVGFRGTLASLAVLGAGISLGSLLRDGARFEEQMNVIRAQARATDDEMRNLEATTRGLGREFGIGAVAVADAAYELQKAGVDIEDVNAGALRSSVELARVLGDDYASAATIAATAMSVFGLEASELQRVTQGIAGTVLAGRFELSDYQLALQQGASGARLAGLSIDDFNALLLLFQRRVGGSGSDMGTLARVFTQRLAPASEEARRRIEELGLEFFDAQGQFRGIDAVAEELRRTFQDMDQESRQRDFNDIFGTDALRAASVLMEEGAEGVERYRRELDEQARVADVAASRNRGLSGAVRELSAEWQELGLTLKDAGVTGFLADALGLVSDLVSGLSTVVRLMAGLTAQVDTSANQDALREQLRVQRAHLEVERDRLETMRTAARMPWQIGGDDALRRQGELVAQYERNIATLQAAIEGLQRTAAQGAPPIIPPRGGGDGGDPSVPDAGALGGVRIPVEPALLGGDDTIGAFYEDLERAFAGANKEGLTLDIKVAEIRTRQDELKAAAEGFAQTLEGTLESAFVNNDWDWSSIGDQIERAWRQAIWDAFLGDSMQSYMSMVAGYVQRLFSGMLGGSGPQGTPGKGGGSTGIVEGEWDWMNGGGWYGDLWRAVSRGIGDLFAGGFADGGYVPPGRWGMAGEEGPEPIYGGRHGLTVVPAGDGGARTTINFNLPPGADAQSFINSRAQIEAMLLRAAARGQRVS